MRFDGGALVIGGLTGIGAAVTRAFAGAGAEVVATGVHEDQVARAEKVEGVEAVRLDVRDGTAVRTFAGGFERLDALVNCAGVIRRKGREFLCSPAAAFVTGAVLVVDGGYGVS